MCFFSASSENLQKSFANPQKIFMLPAIMMRYVYGADMVGCVSGVSIVSLGLVKRLLGCGQ